MEKWMVEHHTFAIENFTNNNLVVSVQRTFRQRFSINGIGI